MQPRFLTIEDPSPVTPKVWATLSPEVRAVMALPVGQRSATEPPMVAMSDADLDEVSEGLLKAWDNQPKPEELWFDGQLLPPVSD